MLKLGYKISKKVVSIKDSVLYYRSVIYAMLMILFGVFGYIFLDSGFNTKTKVIVNYQDNSDIYYEVNYIDSEYNVDKDKHIANMIDYIDFSFNYENILSEYVSGYYKYSVESYLIAYEEDVNDALWERKYQLEEEKVELLDKNEINSIKIEASFRVEFKKYRDEIYAFIDNYEIGVSGYLHVRINILEFLNFSSFDNEYADNKVITIDIPLTDDIFKIDITKIEDRDNYYEFSSNVPMNIVFLIIGAFCVSVSISLLVLVIRQFKIIYSRQSNYSRELKKILSKYDDIIVRIKRFYVNRKYNLIYVDSFSELMDVYEKKNKMISFKEVKRGSESIFVIIDEDDAWIYKLK